MASYNKLVRDKIPQILDAKGVKYEKRVALATEMKGELAKKLEEEAGEFAEVNSAEELADVIEVIEALKALPEFVHVERVRMKKRLERGGFDEGIILKVEE